MQRGKHDRNLYNTRDDCSTNSSRVIMSTRPFPQRVSLQSPIRQLRVEYVECIGWRIWLTANRNFTLGTFLMLNDVGGIQRITWHENGTETIFEVTEDNNG